ncbi:hypothetical protein ScPMuIL_002414 [Solemya velum]
MIRGIDSTELAESRIGDFVQPMIWSYSTDLGDLKWPPLWQKFGENFRTLWVASAFKGAATAAEMYTNPRQHLKNHLQWVEILETYARGPERRVNVRGIALTGWQRFDHFAALCELLPVAMKSLGVCLQTMLHGSFDAEVVLDAVTTILKCEKQISIELEYEEDQICQYPGFEIQHLVEEINFLDFPSDEELRGYLNPYQIKYKVSNQWMLRRIFPRISHVRETLRSSVLPLRRALTDFYDEYTVDEWMEINFNPLLKEYEHYSSAVEEILEQRALPRRPFAVSLPPK